MTLQDHYESRCKGGGGHPDIKDHLPTLRRYAAKVRHITEIGVRTGNSTTALLFGLCEHGGEMHSYDCAPCEYQAPIDELTKANVTWTFHRDNTRRDGFRIAPTELLFIDGDHSFDGVMNDLGLSQYVSTYIVMHDTDPARDARTAEGVARALRAWLKVNGNEWHIIERYPNCNGLTVIERG
jgi:hypothetical protein